MADVPAVGSTSHALANLVMAEVAGFSEASGFHLPRIPSSLPRRLLI
jgi:hypothetical protein